MRVSRRFAVTALLGAALAATGCGRWIAPVQTTPHQPLLGAGGLVPSQKDKDAGLVGIAPGFDVREYNVVAVDQCAVAESEIKDEEDRQLARTMPPFFQAETVRRLRATGLFARVISLGEVPPLDSPDRALRIECIMTRLASGSKEARFFLGHGAGRTKAQIELRFVDVHTDTIVMVTADEVPRK
jgi:hypothetical protein